MVRRVKDSRWPIEKEFLTNMWHKFIRMHWTFTFKLWIKGWRARDLANPGNKTVLEACYYILHALYIHTAEKSYNISEFPVVLFGLTHMIKLDLMKLLRWNSHSDTSISDIRSPHSLSSPVDVVFSDRESTAASAPPGSCLGFVTGRSFWKTQIISGHFIHF